MEPIVLGVLLFGCILVYVLSGGADFGAGVWSLFARLRGEHGAADEAERALGPIWEANHVWLIVVVVILFVGYPAAFAAISTSFHIPLTIALLGIVARGAAYIFSAYGMSPSDEARLWQRLFGIASIVTPFVFGQVVGTIAVGDVIIDVEGHRFAEVYLQPWLRVFPIVCGVFVVCLFAYLAAVYLTIDAATEGAREMFRLYAIFSGIALGALALVSWVAMPISKGGQALLEGLFIKPWSIPLHLATAASALVALYALYKWQFRRARVAAVIQVSLITVGWGLAQYPDLIPGQLSLYEAASETVVLRYLIAALGLGLVVLIPAFVVLFRLFKR